MTDGERTKTAADPSNPDAHKGAVEGDRPGDEQQGNANAGALDRKGLPKDRVAIAEDRIGANEDETQG